MRSVAPWFLLSSLVFLVSFVACGPGDDTGDGGIACEEMCDGDTLVSCDDDGNEVETDCTADFDSCLEIDGEFDCAAAVGSSCLVDGVLSLCEGTEAGCELDADSDDVCVENVGTCAAADERSCEGTVFIAECKSTQPYRIDCDAFDGTCEGDTGCIVPTGQYCDEIDFFCDDGLTCTDFTCG